MSSRKIKHFIFEKIKREIPTNLTFHGLHHTIDVLNVCNQYIKRMKISSHDAFLLRTAALFHDLGFIRAYDNHEIESVKYAKEILPDWNYTNQDIEIISRMILATQIPQKPTSVLEQIICDADLDYLGTDSFYSIGETLFQEFRSYNKISTKEEWDRLQVRFLQKHKFHTPYAKKHRESVKQIYLNEILNKGVGNSN